MSPAMIKPLAGLANQASDEGKRNIEMKKFYMLGLVLVAVFAFGAMTASSAFAVSKLLWENSEILSLLEALAEGFLLLEDMGAAGSPAVLCSGIFDIDIEEGGVLGLVTDLLMLSGELLNENGVLNGEGNDMIDCEGEKTCTGAENLVTVLNLPWHIEIELSSGGTKYLIDFLEEAGKIPTYDVDCNTILGLVEDTCEGLSSARLYIDAAGNLRASFNSLSWTEPDPWAAESEATNCSVGGAGQGLIVSINEKDEEDLEGSGGIISHVNGGKLTLSE